MLYLTDGATTYATYSCDSQYDLYGAQRRACLQDNTWDLEEPSCSKILLLILSKCRNDNLLFSSLANRLRLPSDGDFYKFASHVKVNCKSFALRSI